MNKYVLGVVTGVVVVVGLAGIYLDLKLNEQREQGMWIITFNWTIQGEPDKYMTRILYVDQVSKSVMNTTIPVEEETTSHNNSRVITQQKEDNFSPSRNWNNIEKGYIVEEESVSQQKEDYLPSPSDRENIERKYGVVEEETNSMNMIFRFKRDKKEWRKPTLGMPPSPESDKILTPRIFRTKIIKYPVKSDCGFGAEDSYAY